MQKIVSLALAIVGAFIYFPARAEMKNGVWFKNQDCFQLSIIKYKSVSDDTSVAYLDIKDKTAVKVLIDRIQSLPADGKEQIKVGSKAPRTLLTFSCSDKTYPTFEFINKHIKTPSGGFLGTKNAVEDNLYRDIDGIVQPEFNKRILKIKDHPVQFKDFTIRFTGEKNTPQEPDGPTIGPTTENFFNIWTKGSANQIDVTVFEGQMPAAPQGFVVGKKIYYLLTYGNTKHETLYPNYFEISEKEPGRRR